MLHRCWCRLYWLLRRWLWLHQRSRRRCLRRMRRSIAVTTKLCRVPWIHRMRLVCGWRWWHGTGRRRCHSSSRWRHSNTGGWSLLRISIVRKVSPSLRSIVRARLAILGRRWIMRNMRWLMLTMLLCSLNVDFCFNLSSNGWGIFSQCL